MAYNPCLLIMNPRILTEALESIEKCVDIPVTYFRAFTEPGVLQAINEYIIQSNYTHYIVCADDTIVTEQAVSCVLDHVEDEKYDVFTAWMNMHFEKDGTFSRESTVCFNQLMPIAQPDWGPTREEYPPWVTIETMNAQVKKPLRTAYANFALTGMKKEMWLKYPVKTHPCGRASDHQLSWRLQSDGIEVWTHPDAFITHLRRGWGPLRKRWLVGNEKPQIIETQRRWGKRDDYV